MNNDKTMGSCDTPACCCMDIGTVMDGSDCSAQLQRLVANGDDAAKVLAEWTALANSKASEPVSVAHQLTAQSEQQLLQATITFPCQAEALIFQLAVR